MTVHLVTEPDGARAIRTACEIDLRNGITIGTTKDEDRVTCPTCKRAPRSWSGLPGYNYESGMAEQPQARP